MGFRVLDLGSEFRFQALGIQGIWFRVWRVGLRV
jgi:hypothetical protein